ncbi:IgGFc-binding protein-like [Pelmatolapia mariae]|uniref:IgGFc-binding protein-like n=1 Tax=Pelmatolapia mariae TaxID=158779 RepID=UPI003211D543
MAAQIMFFVLLLGMTGVTAQVVRPLYPTSGTASSAIDDGSSPQITLLRPFFYFGRTYNSIYVNHNGHLTFTGPLSEFRSQRFPQRIRDIIAPFWTDLDNRGNGQIYYNQYTSGSVLQQATRDINQYFPGLNFNANWVFVATWYEVAYYPTSGTRTTIQSVLISGGQYSFVLMNYGIIASTTLSIQAGYDTIGSTHYYVLPGSFTSAASGSNSNFRLRSNVNEPGRWAFRTDHGSTGCTFNGELVQLGASFWSDRTCAQKCTCTSTGLQCRNEPCSFSQICKPASFQFSCQTVPRGTCTISGDPHYYTFDNTVFHFQGTCTYVLSEQCNSGRPYYRVEGKNEHRGSTRVSWTRLVKVHVYNDTIELVKGRRGQAKVNGNFASTPFFLSNGTVQVYESGFSVFVSTDFGLVVSYDTNHYVQISLPYTYQNGTCGLCGNFNGISRDDFQTRDGEVVSSDVVFANSWQASGDDEPGCGPQCGGLDCAVCTVAQKALYSNTDHCGILSSSSGPFTACHQQLPPQSFVDSCVYDLCVGGGYQPILCQALTVYASQCQQNGIQLPSWRRPGFCEIPCPANSHFESEGTGCPPTCVNPNSTHNCPLPPQESCICDSGYILSGGVCVPHAECGCRFEGRYYRSGQTVILDEDCGRRCSCSYGSMTCRSHGCGPLESCRVEDGERGCRPNSYATCWIRGPGSYQTFDGLTYQYPGACRLTLAKVMGLSSHPHFMVTGEKLPRGQQGFARILHFEAEGIHISIEMARNSKVKVNGQLIRLPFSTPSNRIQIFHSSIYSVIIRTSFGVTVQTVWPHFVRVTAPGVYNGSLGGLCGNYNGHPHDDFNTPNGVLVNSSQDFGDSWRDGSLAAHCVESMNQNSTANYNSSEYCGILSSPDGPFVPCWSVVDPRQQVDVCVEIMRGSNNPASTLCGVLRDYALMCQQKGVALGQWRNATGCALTCPSNSHYELCGTSCPSACPSLSFPFTCDTVCQEGCQCNSGFILNGDQCVPPTSCGCYHQGRYHQGGEQFWDGEECQSLCTCNGNTGNVHCTPTSCGPQESCRVVEGEFGCHPNPHGTCSASGDPHYITFDRKAYDFQGTCRYVLVTLCNATDELNQFSVEAKNEALNGRPLSIVAEVFVNVWGYDVHMSRDRRGLVQVNGVTRNLPIILNEGNVSIYATGSRILVSTNFGLSVTYNGYSAVFISVPPNYREKICGLCGNFNGNPNDDFHTPSGTIVTSPDEFGRAWKVPGNYTCNDGCGSSCPQCTNEQPARDQCEVIQASDGPFSFCHEEVDPAPYFNDCVFDVCLSGNQGHDLLCSATESYVSACQSANVRIYPWRENTTCTLDCPTNSHYELCGTDCGHTCASSIDETCEQFCSEGCFCDEGFIKSGTRCVPVESCGCQYDGFYYDAGESFWTDGCSQRCECHAPNDLRCSASSCTPEQQCSIRDGQLGCYDAMSTCNGLQCRNEPCSFSQICKPASFQFSCQTVPRGTCTISGDPHYYTFDNTVFHFQGTCTYVLSEQCNSGRPYYRVEGKNEHRGSTRVSWTRLVKVHVYNDTIELVKGRHGQAKVNGNFASTPFFLSNGTVQVYESGFSVFVSTDFGLVVSYDTNHYVQISLPYTYQNAGKHLGMMSLAVGHSAEESCICDSGYILSGGVCVPHAECGCRFEGRYYRSGQTVNGQLIRLPFSTPSNRIQIFHSSIYSVIIRTSFGVTVQTVWPHFVRVTAPGVYNGSLGGLCGNYNGHPHDDFNTPNGVLVNSSQDFGDSWRDGSLAAHCVESMNQNSTANYNSSEYCGILSSPDGPFVPCWSVVDPRQQVDVCVEIMRGSNNPASTLCGVLRDYALMCQQKGVALGQWRNATGCALTCPSNSHYELCGTSCPSACPSLSFPFTCDTVCQEGCQCNSGFILNGDQCVPPTSCGCYHQGRYHQGGEQFWDGEECQSLCTCNGNTGNVHCTPTSCGPQESCRVVEGEFGCHPNPHGTCSASGDPHYITFDRKAYDFQGTCRYVLVTLCNATDELNQFSVEAKNEALNGRPLSIVAEVFVNVWGYDVHMSRDRRGLVQCTNEQPARDQCEVIQASDGPFSFCHEEVDPAPYFSDCVFDVCLSGNQGHDLLCSATESYVSACQSANVRIYPWRENTTCTLDCPTNSHYELCGTDCGHTCASSIDETCEQFCSEGCFCDEGFIKSGTRCVPVESCGCQYDGFYYDAGESFWTDGCSQRCECHAPNDLRCSASSCTPEQQCSIRDGQLGCYDAMSTCNGIVYIFPAMQMISSSVNETIRLNCRNVLKT